MRAHRVTVFLALSLAALAAAGAARAQAGAHALPEGLFSPDPAQRIAAIGQVEAARDALAIDKLSAMARADAVAEVRAAACRALGALGATAHLDLLVALSTSDPNDGVRAAADKAARRLRGEPEPEAKPIFAPAAGGEQGVAAGPGDEAHKAPQLARAEPEQKVQTLHFAFGFGSMGGYGLAAIDMRGRIPLPAKYLPWIGIEIGGGWTAPQVYVLTSGLMDPVTDSRDARWKLISGGAAVLFYLHRNHYIPLRGGFDPGQGPYGQLGYGFEMLNEEGFFSWGLELGIHVHPAAADYARDVVDREDWSDGDKPKIWVVAPFVRFVLHFYLI